jgi:hypothetical protein
MGMSALRVFGNDPPRQSSRVSPLPSREQQANPQQGGFSSQRRTVPTLFVGVE